MAAQIELGLEIAEMARQDIESGVEPTEALADLIRKCLGRDTGWKAFYVDQMSEVKPGAANEQILRIYSRELEAEQAFFKGDYSTAMRVIQALLDSGAVNKDDKGWYLQEIARYLWASERVESQRFQVAAHKSNHLLLKPDSGVTVAKLTLLSHGRIERIAAWIGQFSDYANLDVCLTEILGRLVFGTKADHFEQALDELSRAFGFAGERPDKEWKEGPDNLWALDSTQYILWECKSEVDVQRAEINKHETEQMNRSNAWFAKHYPGMTVKSVIIHPTHVVSSAAALTHDVEAMRENELKKLVKSAREFFKSFESMNLKDLSDTHIQKTVNAHGLSVDDLLTKYSRKLKNLRS